MGLAYYGTFKLTDDQFDSRLASRLIRDKNRVWGLGPEVTLALATKQAVYGFVTVRYQWELAARTTTEGAAWNITGDLPAQAHSTPAAVNVGSLSQAKRHHEIQETRP